MGFESSMGVMEGRGFVTVSPEGVPFFPYKSIRGSGIWLPFYVWRGVP